MKRRYIIIALLWAASSLNAQTVSKVQFFPLNKVELLDSPFKHAQDLDKQYLLELNADRLLAPFLKEAELESKAEGYTNWEKSGLSGHIGGHYLSALSQMAAATGDTAIIQRLDYMLSELKRVQDANGNGYIGGVPNGKVLWKEIAQGNIKPSGFSLNGRWVPLYNIHKTYAGLRDVYLNTGNEMAKKMLVKMTDWMLDVVKGLSDEQLQDMLRSEHGGLNETFADVADITGDERYLQLAHRFSHQLILEPLLAHKDELTGKHANTQIPKVIGYKRIADIEHNDEWSEASRYFWENVVSKRSVCIGGNSTGEHFNATNDFSRMIKSTEGPETCNTYNMLRLSKMLYRTSADKTYMDYYERALYNHILSTQNPNTGGLVYFTQMRPGHYRTYSQPHTSMWCCVGSGIENHSKYGEMIYAYDAETLYVNLFIPSRLQWDEKDTEIVQETKFPESPYTKLTINPRKKKTFTLKVRHPKWVNDGEIAVRINGKSYAATTDNGYISISKKWEKGDCVEITLPMHVTAEQLPDHSQYYAFLYGPIVLAAKTTTDNQKGLFANDSRGGHGAPGKLVPLKEIPIVVSQSDALPATLIKQSDQPLTFRLSALSNGQSMDLVPFYTVHETRYIIYWPQATTEELVEIRRKIEQDERERLRLESITIDKVVCGEQQPESDHAIQFNDSRTGTELDMHWREAKGWFSYELKNENKKARNLYIKYFNREWKRTGEILVNGQKIATLTADKGKNDEEKIMSLPLPENLWNNTVFIVKFEAIKDSVVPRIMEVRVTE